MSFNRHCESACPIDDIIPHLRVALLKHSSAVLHAPPGAGKTTRVPLALLDVLPSENGRIIMLEPRRLAAVSAARWMSELIGEEVGGTVGYSIRFDSRTSESTRIEVVTEGILTRRIQADPALEGMAIVIFDEFHERSLHADLALALCLDVRKNLRNDLKVLVMSATLDCGPISSLLGDAPVISSVGRAFPVEEKYIADRRNIALSARIAEATGMVMNETEGDILIFLPGAGEIRACAEALSPLVRRLEGSLTLHPLYGDLPFEEQERAIVPSGTRKIVLATNIAETSLTIQGVQVVIDSGLTRRLQHDPSTGMNRLVTVSVSKASAEQRKGRAGRLGPGACYRLYSRNAFQSMLPFAPPDIVVSDLTSLVLELAAWGVKNSSELSWLDAPPEASWNAAKQLLSTLGALDRVGSITQIGKAMVRLPLQPRLARLVIKAGELGNPGLSADLAALLSERDIIRRKASSGMMQVSEPDIAERLDILYKWRRGTEVSSGADLWAIRNVERTSGQILRLMQHGTKDIFRVVNDHEAVARLLLSAFPDRIAKKRGNDAGRFVLVHGRGLRFATAGSLDNSPYIVAAHMDAGEKGEGIIHIAAALTEETIREECSGSIDTVRRIEWDKRENRIVATMEERLGAIVLSTRDFSPSDEEAGPILCDAIRLDARLISFSREVRQLQGRDALMSRLFPDESWPDMSDSQLLSSPEEWLLPWLGGVRNAQDISRIDILSALKARLSGNRMRLLDKRAPTHIEVPSGHKVALDYTSGDTPVLAVKLQEMFGLADTPTVADGRTKVLLHLLSPARRPVQVTQDLKGFWNNGYQQVKKELKGRYPKHPWPDDPWNAAPTGKTKNAMKG
ncbi:MAG TPA: ATP-dependent helicase HrpB [Dissulfurispiraceae bacterium]|nr:ATP-dependent helicase HrpB [Dissulfurispiraceae bacterium]